jgi:beta-lactamase regulating signal transducer with metallopeptidase domain
VKLMIPPSLAFPTGAGWWLRSRTEASAAASVESFAVAHPRPDALPPTPTTGQLRRASLSLAGWGLICWCIVSLVLLSWVMLGWVRLVRKLRNALPAPDCLEELLAEAAPLAGWRGPVNLKLTEESVSPAVCGVFRPTIVLPSALVTRLPAERLRLVFLHELIHLRNRDIWVNCLQALFQIAYWWHPLVWVANARIRRAREEAVDDAVMATLEDEGSHYASTLLEVARLAMKRPLAALGLVGILESKGALPERIERLLSFASPQRAGLTFLSAAGISVFSAIALPMGKAPPKVGAEYAQAATTTCPLTNTYTEASAGLNDRSDVRRAIYNKLLRIKLETVRFDDLALSDVIKTLNAEAKQRDPEGEGVNFTLNTAPEMRLLDPATGQPVTPAPAEMGLENVSIKLSLEDVRLIDLLDAILKVAHRRIQYSLETQGVVFRFPPSGITAPVPLLTRIFKVEPNYFKEAANSVTGSAGVSRGRNSDQTGAVFSEVATSSGTKSSLSGIQDFFLIAGVDFYPPKSLFYSEGNGMLLAHATREDMEKMEAVLTRLNNGETNFTQAAPPIVRPRETPIGDGQPKLPGFRKQRNPTEGGDLKTRIFKVTPLIFLENVRRAKGLSATATLQETIAAFRKIVAERGLDLSAPKAILFDEGAGRLLVRASAEDLEIIQTLAVVLDQPR